MGFGSDFSGVDDLDARMTFLSGDKKEVRALTQAIARRLLTPRGGLFYDRNYGLDIRSFIGDTVDPVQAQRRIEAECEKDQRVKQAVCFIEVDGETWTININCIASTGQTFSLTLAVSKVTVELLKGQT